MPLLSEVLPEAKSAGAVNTILVDPAGRLTGTNTDIAGISATIAELRITPSNARVLVAGAGGAARAAVSCLTAAGAAVSVTNRTMEKARTLAAEFGATAVPRDELSAGYDLIINATPAGMSGFSQDIPVPVSILTPDTAVFDMVYEPEMTPLLAAAGDAGVRAAVCGKAMLIAQAAASFTLWGRGVSYGALSVINAIAMGKGAGFGIDLKTEATVRLTAEPEIVVEIDGHPSEDTRLARFSVEEMLRRYPESGMQGAVISTTSNIPISQGLKSSSAATNAILAATADALGVSLDPLEIGRIGATVAIAAGVSITGTFDDACACMLGGLVFTDNPKRELLHRMPMPDGYKAVIHLPEYQVRKSAFPKYRMREMASEVSAAYDRALAGDVFSAMYLNGACTCRALGIEPEVADRALACGAAAAGLSGTGPATGILVETDRLDEFLDAFGRDQVIVANVRNGDAA